MKDILGKLSISDYSFGSCIGGDNWIENKENGIINSINPSNGETIASVYKCSESDYEKVIEVSNKAFLDWRKVPAPIRGQLIFKWVMN